MTRKLLSCLLTLVFVATASAQKKDEPRYSVPDINGRATLLIKPFVSDPKFDGKTVTVKVVVDTDGSVISATCSTTCPSTLKEPAETAAKASAFSPLLVKGRFVKYDGILIYTFAVSRINWFRFGTALESTHIFDNISLGRVADILPTEWSEERIALQEIDKLNDVEARIRAIESAISRFQQKLTGEQLWEFELGMAVRRITTPFQSDRGVIRDEIQADLRSLKRFLDSAPEGVKEENLAALRSLVGYEIAAETKNDELARDIYRLVSQLKFGTR